MKGLCEGGNEPPGSLKATIGVAQSVKALACRSEVAFGRGFDYPAWADYLVEFFPRFSPIVSVDGIDGKQMVFGEMRQDSFRLPEIITVQNLGKLNQIGPKAHARRRGVRAVASWSKASRLGLTLRNARWFESSWGKKFSHEISASVWDRCPPSIVMHLGSYDR
ncbi:hypothetical protein ANN_10542 [Periplaneta americana]|uniref:Per a allergen n=1 Tax=Periplaneta americana TaxID=6978 RepID=A0ABQ8TPA6_PERAM|nr:hypothetical protein ANN_10542 [Periplaneta americana]